MSVSRNKIGEMLEFFDMTGRKCIVIWERTIPEVEKPTFEISASVKPGYGDFFRAASMILQRAADDIDSREEEEEDREDGDTTLDGF